MGINVSNFFTPEFNNESAIAPWNASLEPTKAIIPQLDANRVLTGGVGQEVNLQTLTPESYDNIILPDASPALMASALTTDSKTSLPDSSVDLLTGQAMSEVYQDLSKFAADPDFAAKMNVAFGENWDAAAAKTLAEAWFQGDFSDIPPVKIVSSAEIGGANGAFVAATDTIYLSKEFLAENAMNPVAVADVLLEEIGHSVDARLNVTDSPGDEGAIFGAVVQGKELTQGELQALKGKDDTATVVLGGENTTIEMNQQRWTLNSYLDWRNQNFNWGKPNNTSYPNGNRPDGKDGIYINWRNGSPFDPPNTDIVNPLDYFATSGSTQANFEAGKTYKFRVSADDNMVMGVGQNGKPFNWLTLNQNNKQVEWQNFPNGSFKEYTWTPTNSGSYQVQFWHLENTGDANVDISWEAIIKPSDLNGTVTRNGQTLPVSLKRVDGNGAPTDSTDIKNRPTWVVIHGMNNSPKTDSITKLSKAIDDYKTDDQVLVLDWSKEAFSDSKLWTPWGQVPNPYFGGSWISTVATWLKQKLVDEWKISSDNINFAGHSLGSYLAWDTAKKIGGVNKLIALDPATTTNGGYQEGNVNFSDYSKWAWAFYGSALGNPNRANTAEESFQFSFPSLGFNEIDKHGAVVTAFADTIKQNQKQPGYFTSLLNIDKMNSSAAQPWKKGDGFEATLQVNKSNNNEWVISNTASRVWTGFGNALVAS